MGSRCSTRWLMFGLCAFCLSFGMEGAIAASDQTASPQAPPRAKSEPGKAAPGDKELADVQSELSRLAEVFSH
jgi:hypothetical protein